MTNEIKPPVVRCNDCMRSYREEQLESIEDMSACPWCHTDEYLMDLEK